MSKIIKYYDMFCDEITDIDQINNKRYWCKEEYMIISNKKEGEFKSHNKYGQILIECFYKDDKKEGEYKQYYSNGKIEEECFYRNNQIKGEYKSYYSDGRIFKNIIIKTY